MRYAIGCVLALLVVAGCARPAALTSTGGPDVISVGGIYAVKDPDGTWRILKVLVVEPDTVHVRSYANKYREQPRDVDPATLTMGGLGGPAGMGIDHIPIDRDGFLRDRPVLFKIVPVTESELLGYKYYTGELGDEASP